MISFSVVVAMDLENGIGKNGQLPWKLSVDMKHFKEITTKISTGSKAQNAVIMGRKTWESLPEKFKPLPQRLNVVLTRNRSLSFPTEVLKDESLGTALEAVGAQVEEDKIESIFVIGGGEIFKDAIKNPLCKRLYITQIFNQFHCDTFFPEFRKNFKQISASPRSIENGLEYQFAVYERI